MSADNYYRDLQAPEGWIPCAKFRRQPMSDESKYTLEGGLRPGDPIAVEINGELHHDTVHSIRYTSAEPEIRQQPTGWRKILRAMTPARWRKPLPIVRPYKPAGVEVIGESETARRAHRVAEDMNKALNQLLGER